MSTKPKAADVAAQGSKYLGTPYSTMDCQAFVERCLRDAGLSRDLPGSNTWYRQMTWTGTPEECKKTFGSIPRGAFLYILEQDGKEPQKYQGDGIGNASHIGIKTGTGKGAIHSSAKKGCVAESAFADKTVRNGGWNRIGLWSALDYGDTVNAKLGGTAAKETQTEKQEVAKSVTLLKRGSKGTAVEALQNLLNGLGYSCGEVDGIFGKNTEAAVKSFQKDNGLTVDGIAGSATQEVLAVRASTVSQVEARTVTIYGLTPAEAEHLQALYPWAEVT